MDVLRATLPPPLCPANAALLCPSIDRAPPKSIAVRLIPGAGRGVVALTDIPKGTIVFEEEPYIMIPMANRRRLAVCLCCGEQVVDKDRIAAAGGGDVDDDEVSNSSLASKAVADDVESFGGVMCEGGCGECYCSKECKEMFHTRSHINAGTCAALRLCRPAMSKLNTVDYNHLRAMVALGMKAKSEGVAGGFLRGDPAAAAKKKSKKTTRNSDSDEVESSSVTEDSDWDDLPNWKRNKLVAERKAERKAAREAAGEVEEGTILPIHIKGIQTAFDAPDFDGSTAKFSVIDVLDEEESAAVTKRRARVQSALDTKNANKGATKRPKAPVDEPLEVVCDALVAAQMPPTSVSSNKSRNLDDYYLTVDVQHAPKDPTFSTAIAPLVTNYSDFVEEQLDSFRDVYNAYCDLFPPAEGNSTSDNSSDEEDRENEESTAVGGGGAAYNTGPIQSIHDVVDLTTLPVFSEYMFLKISAAFQCNGFSIYNTSLRRTHDREVGIGKEMLAPSTFRLAGGRGDEKSATPGCSLQSSPNHKAHADINSATVSPMVAPFTGVSGTPEIAQLTSTTPPTTSTATISPSSRPEGVRRVPADDRSATPVRDLELLTGVYGYAAYFNHACAPNIKKTFGGPRGRTLQFVTLKNVSKGDQICISYCGDSSTSAGSQEVGGSNLKRWRLQKQYYFLCCCPICERKK